jgi:dolichol-phosphate mannosyltransferase
VTPTPRDEIDGLGRVVMVIPTYNEAENLPWIVGRLRAAHPAIDVLVVDDGSPDGTGAIADRLAAELPAVEVLHRTAKEGLGRAYLAGFEHAIGRGAELLIEMDSDFSHDPADLPRLIAAADSADLVLGSRYVKGGGVTDWGLFRRALSRGGSMYARFVLGLGIRDLTGGFKCFHREALERIDYRNTLADGYGFQIELSYRACKAGLRVVEIPIVFRDRAAGTSKMTARIALEAIWKVPALRFR